VNHQETWTRFSNVNELMYLASRALRRRGLTVKLMPFMFVGEASYIADGYTTRATVSVGNGKIQVSGYGVSVKGGRDKFNEKIGATIAITRAFECAATVLKQQLLQRR